MDTVITTENNRNDLLKQSKKNSLLQEVINVLLQIYYATTLISVDEITFVSSAIN